MSIDKIIQQKKESVYANKGVIQDLIYLLHMSNNLLLPLHKDKLNYENLLKLEGVKDVLAQINMLITEKRSKK